MNTAELKAEGAARRDAGIARAAKSHTSQIRRGELLLLDALLAAPNATATTDVIADDPRVAYADSGKWVGSIPMQLLKSGIISEVAIVKSNRPTRHGGLTRLYTIADAVKAHNRRDILRRQIAANEARQLKSDAQPLTISTTQV